MADVSRLPGPNADFWDWQLRGSCRGTDSDLFFHPEGERGQARTSREEAAKEVCLHCPVCKLCREHALRVHEPYGVWGGMTEEDREEHYVREKAAARAAKLAALAGNGKPARKPAAKVPVKIQAKASGAPATAPSAGPSNGMTMTRPANAAAAAGARAKAAKTAKSKAKQ